MDGSDVRSYLCFHTEIQVVKFTGHMWMTVVELTWCCSTQKQGGTMRSQAFYPHTTDDCCAHKVTEVAETTTKKSMPGHGDFEWWRYAHPNKVFCIHIFMTQTVWTCVYQKICLQSSGWVYDLNHSRLSMVLLRSSFCDSLFQCLHIGEKTFLEPQRLSKSYEGIMYDIFSPKMKNRRTLWCINIQCVFLYILPLWLVSVSTICPSFSHQFWPSPAAVVPIAGTIFIEEGKPTRWILCSSELSNRL